MAKEYEIALRKTDAEEHFLRIRRRPKGDVELRVWRKAVGGPMESLASGFFVPHFAESELLQVLTSLSEDGWTEESPSEGGEEPAG